MLQISASVSAYAGLLLRCVQALDRLRDVLANGVVPSHTGETLLPMQDPSVALIVLLPLLALCM